VAFQTNAENLDPRDTEDWDIYVKDLLSGALILASISEAGVKGNADSERPALSDDGTKVAFETSATNLDPRDTDGDLDVYVKDLVTGRLTLASAGTGSTGEKGNNKSYDPSISGDGTRVAFTSRASNLDPRDEDDGVDI
jgi:Tol biopolymer transport system component